jgi:Protein of unknown function (DUF3048) C-terminal domain/Protein of unknown function (DUF3048) N-terminal domain
VRKFKARAGYATAASVCGIAAVIGCAAVGGSATTAANKPSVSATSPASKAPSAAAKATPAGPQSGDTGGTVAPLTGLTVSAAVAQRPAVAVAVAAADPVGLGTADLVLEEMTAPVRFLALFQSAQAPRVGPVAATRPMDGQALSVLHPVTGYDGGTSSFVSVLDATRIVDGGYARHPSAYAPGPAGLTVSTSALAAAGGSDGPPPELLPYRTAGTPLASTGESHPTSVRITIPGQPGQQWKFDTRTSRWVETAGGPQVSVANLIVQIVPFKTVYLSRKYGETTQSAQVIGTSRVIVFSGATPGGGGGTAAAGTWHKPGIAGLTDYFDAAGLPMSFGPGPTWIILAPAGTSTSQAGGGQS